MEAKFSQRVKDVLAYSREEALRLGNDYIGVEHLLLGILREGEGLAIQILQFLGVNLNELRRTIEQAIASNTESSRNLENIPLIKQAERALKITYLEAKIFKTDLIGTEHLLLAVLKDEDNIVTKSLKRYAVDYDSVRDELKSIIAENDVIDVEDLPAHLRSAERISTVDYAGPLFADDTIIPFEKLKEESIRHALKITKGNIVEAAKRLQLGRATIYRLMEKYSIENRAYSE